MNSEKRLAKEVKRQRVPVGGMRTSLQLSDEDNKAFKRRKMVGRWFNDQHGRLPAALAGGYTYVNPSDVPSLGGYESAEGDNTDLGSRVSKVVSRSGPEIRAFLMEIAQEFFDEDQDAKIERTREVDRALQATNQGGQSIEGGYTPK